MDNALSTFNVKVAKGITFGNHPACERLDRVVIPKENLSELSEDLADWIERKETKGPTREWFSENYSKVIERVSAVLEERKKGGLTIEFERALPGDGELTALFMHLFVHSIGDVLPETRNTNGLGMSPRNVVEIKIGHKKQYDQRLLHFSNPRLPWPLHTDRTLHEDVGDFLLVYKAKEFFAVGGKIRFLHVDDIPNLNDYLKVPAAREDLEWKGDERFAPPWLQSQILEQPGVSAPVFELANKGPTVRFTDFRFRRPKTKLQVQFLRELDIHLQRAAKNVKAFSLPVGAAYLVNNRVMLHGREGFSNTKGLERVLHRYCGNLK